MKKHKILLKILLLLTLTWGCAKKSPTQPISNVVDTVWRLESLEVPGNIIKPKSDQLYSIQFNADKTLSGNADCNTMGGTYSFGENGSVALFNLYATEMYCGDESFGEIYLAALLAAKTIEIDKDKLVIYYDDNSKLSFTAIS